MLSIFSPWPWVALALSLLVGAYGGFGLGDKWGANARAYRAVVKELARKNVELETLKHQDEREIAEANAARDVATEHATAALKNLGSCPVSKAQAELLNKIGE